MKTRISLTAALAFLLLAVSACSPTATASVPPETSPTTPPTLFNPLQPSPEAPTATTEEPTEPLPTSAALPPLPQPAAPAHFHPGDPIQVDFIHMVNQSQGWGISGAYVLVTADGGQTWREAMPPDPFPEGAPDKAYGAFWDQKTAWIVFSQNGYILPEASVWHTTDSGYTWTRSAPLAHQVSGESVWADFAVLDAQNVWLMVRSYYLTTCTEYNHELFHTADGGLTWTSLDGQTSDDYTGMIFRDPLNGLRTLQTTGCGYGSEPPAYDVTTDGGANWEGRELPPPPDAPDLFNQYINCETYQPSFFSTTFIRMLVGCFDDNYSLQKFTSYVYFSEDDGKTWNSQLLPDKVLASADTLIFFGAYPTLLLGRDMYQNSNGGFGDWTYIKTVSWDGQFSFVDPQTGWAVARSGSQVALVATVNGGGSWSMIQPTITK